MVIVWGANTVHSIPTSGAPATPAPTAFSSFGSPAPNSGSSLFGGTPASGGSNLFPAPAPFGAPQASRGIFGNPAPAPFASPSGSLFGAPASGGFFGGAPPTAAQPPPGPQIPAQAAMQAHYDARARQAQVKLQSSLANFQQIYTGGKAATEEASAPFTCVAYNPASSSYQMEASWHLQQGGGGRPLLPRPDQISPKDWELAAVRCPDGYMPVAMVGPPALLARKSAQQEQVKQMMEQIANMRDFQVSLKERSQVALDRGLRVKETRKEERRQLLWRIMQKLELLRAYNVELQPDEIKAFEQTYELRKQVHNMAPKTANISTSGFPKLVMPDGHHPVDLEQVKAVLGRQHLTLMELIPRLNKDVRDIKLLKERLQED